MEQILDVWYGFVAANPHLVSAFSSRHDGAPLADYLGAVRKRFGLDDAVLYGPRGCQLCRGSGYKGRLGIFEILPMSPDIVAAIDQRTPPDQVHRDSGRPTLLQDGIRKVRAGVTTLDEILRVTT